MEMAAAKAGVQFGLWSAASSGTMRKMQLSNPE